jgi:adenylate cyclase
VNGLDRLAAEHGVEKLKTIGDAYMAVAGVPSPAPDSAERLALMALRMQGIADETGALYGVALKMRVGIALGPVMAGVSGSERFSYDIWGDAVNLAARLENTGEPRKVHVSDAFRRKLAGAFVFTYRGAIEIKGVGPQETWFLEGPAPSTTGDAPICRVDAKS